MANQYGMPNVKEEIKVVSSISSKMPKKGYGGKVDVWVMDRLVSVGISCNEGIEVVRAFKTFFNIKG